MRARDVLLSEQQCREVWTDVDEMDDVEATPMGMLRVLHGTDRFEGNVFLYEVRTALDEYGLFDAAGPMKRQCSRRFRQRCQQTPN